MTVKASDWGNLRVRHDYTMYVAKYSMLAKPWPPLIQAAFGSGSILGRGFWFSCRIAWVRSDPGVSFDPAWITQA